MYKKWICLLSVCSMLFCGIVGFAASVPEDWFVSDSQYYDGLRYVRANGKCGYIDADGNIVLPIEYDVLSYFTQGLAILAKDGKYGYVDNQGNIVVSLEFDEAIEFHIDDNGYTPVCKDGRWGYLKNPLQETNPDGSPIIHWMDGAHRLWQFHKGTAMVVYDDHVSLINTAFEEIFSGPYDSIEQTNEDGFFIIAQNGKRGVMHYDGSVILPIEYDMISIQQMESGARRFHVVKDNFQKCGVFNLDGSVVLACVFDDLLTSTEPMDIIIAAYGGKWGILSATGEELVPFVYDEILTFDSWHSFQVILDGKYGLINESFEEILPPIYEQIDSMYNGFQAVKKDGLWGYVDESGAVVIPMQFEEVGFFRDGITVVKQNGKYGCINEKGQFVIPAEYDVIERPHNREGYMEKDGVRTAFQNPMLLDYQVPDTERYIILQIGVPQMYTGSFKTLDTAPIIAEDRTLLPLRAVVEQMGGRVNWDAETQTAEFTYQDKTILLQAGNTVALVNGTEQMLDVAPQILNDRTMMPLRFVMEEFGANVIWDGLTQKITITY